MGKEIIHNAEYPRRAIAASSSIPAVAVRLLVALPVVAYVPPGCSSMAVKATVSPDSQRDSKALASAMAVSALAKLTTRMSGRPLSGAAPLGIGKDIRPKQAQVHQARIRDTVSSPVRDRRRLHVAQARNFIGSAEPINYCVRVHAWNNKACLIYCQGMPYEKIVRLT